MNFIIELMRDIFCLKRANLYLMLLTCFRVAAKENNAEQPPFQLPPIFTMGKSSIFGSGCTRESIQIITSPNEQTITVLFSEYLVEASEYGRSIDRKTCNVAVPIDVKEGKSIGIFRVDYRGNAYIPPNTPSFGSFSAEYFFAGSEGYKINEKFEAGYDDDFIISFNVTEADMVYCDCGASTVFRINTAIFASYDANDENVFSHSVEVSVDSADSTISSGLEYYFAVVDC